MEKQRIQWLAVLRGFNIVLVVMFHVQLIDMTTGENHLFCTAITEPFNPIRMPLFIFCSGGLLYLSRIKKEWSIKDLYVDKIYRILCPFLFFVTFYYFFKVLLNAFVKTKVPLTLTYFLESFCIYPNHPSAHLWFLAVLFWFMLLYPLFVWLCKEKTRMMLFLAFTILFYLYGDVSIDGVDNYFYIFSLNRYLVYFFFGIFFFKYELYRYFRTVYSLLATVLVYSISYSMEIPLITEVSGILFMISLCQLLAVRYPSLFISFREYIYQIFLMSFIFQPFVELILWKKLFYQENLFLVFYVLNVLSGIYLPVLISQLAERSSCRVLKICLGLKTA